MDAGRECWRPLHPVNDNYAITARRDVRVISRRNRIFVAIGSPNRERHKRNLFKSLANIRQSCADYIKNFPSRITCWPLNQMSKSRPTQSICVLEAQFAPVCSA